MDSLQVRDSTDDKVFEGSNLSEVEAQILMTTLKHRMAVQKALDIIKSRMQDLPTLDQLASSSGLSRTYFSCVFKEVTGMRLQDYLIKIRLDKAKDLLEKIDLKIKQIAYEVGFSDPNYFCRMFKQKLGQSPTNWRVSRILEKYS